MMDRKAEPEIRFKGFTDSWEQRKFGDFICSIRQLKRHAIGLYSNLKKDF